VFTNNITPANSYGVIGTNSCCGSATLNSYAPGAVFISNAIENIAQSGGSPSQYPVGNFWPAAWTDLPFVDSTACPAGNLDTTNLSACALAPTSPYLTAGTDGRPLGPDMTGLASATLSVAP